MTVLWPMCGLCQRPVDDIAIDRDPRRHSILVTATCHGRAELVELTGHDQEAAAAEVAA